MVAVGMRNQTGLDGLRGDAQPAKRLGGTNEISRLPAFHLEMVAAYVHQYTPSIELQQMEAKDDREALLWRSAWHDPALR